MSASTTAGKKFAVAVPDVDRTATGRPEPFAAPNAWKAAERSSMTTRATTSGCSLAAIAIAAERDPGDKTTSLTPFRASSSMTVKARAVETLGWVT
jgi:hypothetical protein